MVKEKVVKKNKNGSIRTGYYDEQNVYIILHSFMGVDENNQPIEEPAIIQFDGTKAWYKDGLLHRNVGVDENNQPNYLPAITYNNGEKYWYVDGKRYWLIENKKYFNIEDVLEKYKDKIIKSNGSISQKLVDSGIEFINIIHGRYLILNDTQRNEVILKYG